MIRAILVLLTAGAGAGLVSWLLGMALRRLVKGRGSEGYWHATQHNCQPAFSASSIAAAMYFALPLTNLPPKPLGHFRHWLFIALIAALAWLIVKQLHLVEDLLFDHVLTEPQNPRGRRTRTQVQVIRRLTGAIVVLLAIGTILTTFRPVREAGLSLLASAGVVGLVLGIAAQPSLSGAVSGVQVAFTDALRIEDVVVVEGEWGRIEQVQLTHVVIRMWDGRRLILPTSYFTSKPYQNWTRYETRVLGAVDLPVDYTADLDTLRGEAERLVEGSPLWDRSEWQLQMIDVTPQAVTIRLTASAADGPSAWDLRCEVREGLVRFLRDQHPQWMPRRAGYQA